VGLLFALHLRDLRWILILMIISLAACAPSQGPFTVINPEDIKAEPVEPAMVIPEDEVPKIEEITQKTDEVPQPSGQSMTFTEGDLVKVDFKATDPDGDPLTITFSKPLNEKGEWQTKEGDAGSYPVTITVSDSKTSVTKELLVVVESKNHAPVIAAISPITVSEGETITLAPEVSDEDGDEVSISYGGFMTGSEYKTTFKDAGKYSVTISASDGKATATQNVEIAVLDVNRAPILESLQDIILTEGETVVVAAVAADPDNDEVTISYSNPLNERGEWRTVEGDAGKYRVTVVASDNSLEASKSFFVVVEPLNQPPVIESISITVRPLDASVSIGENRADMTLDNADDTKTIVLEVQATDPNKDTVSVSYGGFMDSDEGTVGWDDAGEQKVFITASDGKREAKQTVTLMINRAPQLVIG